MAERSVLTEARIVHAVDLPRGVDRWRVKGDLTLGIVVRHRLLGVLNENQDPEAVQEKKSVLVTLLLFFTEIFLPIFSISMEYSSCAFCVIFLNDVFFKLSMNFAVIFSISWTIPWYDWLIDCKICLLIYGRTDWSIDWLIGLDCPFILVFSAFFLCRTRSETKHLAGDLSHQSQNHPTQPQNPSPLDGLPQQVPHPRTASAVKSHPKAIPRMHRRPPNTEVNAEVNAGPIGTAHPTIEAEVTVTDIERKNLSANFYSLVHQKKTN